jgi:hypothetical protein
MAPTPKVCKDDPVAVEHIDGHWAVQVFEDGEVYQRLFESEEYANSFAAGQRLRFRARPPTGDEDDIGGT